MLRLLNNIENLNIKNNIVFEPHYMFMGSLVFCVSLEDLSTTVGGYIKSIFYDFKVSKHKN